VAPDREGITGPVERVVVVGAGIAGLTVANALAHAGVDAVVLEARDRVGGRLHTITVDGVPVDLGGSWIHHPQGNPMRDFAEAAGIGCRPGNPLPALAGYDHGAREPLSADEVAAVVAMLVESFPAAVDGCRSGAGPDVSAADAVEAFLVTAAAGSPRRARQALRSVVEADAADLAERQSLRWLWTEQEYGGDYFGDLPDGGYRSLVTAMATGLDVRCGVEVAEVAVHGAGVRVTDVDGGVELGSHAVVTIPLGVLKSGTPAFVPGLPPDRSAAVDRLGFGRYDKVLLAFDRPFWTDAGLTHLMLFPDDPRHSVLWVFHQGTGDRGAGDVLAVHVLAGAADLLTGPPADVTGRLLAMLAGAVGHPCPPPSAVHITSWADDRYSRGAYAHVPPGASPADLDLLGEPLHGRLLFAGEHTQSARTGYADGALSSGRREAARLLGRPDVTVGRLSGREVRRATSHGA
jgi:polyamine oxidase